MIRTEDFLFELTGHDALEWLQGQVTQDLRSLEVGKSVEACLCKATGQIEDILVISRQENRLLIVCQRRNPLQDRVKQFVIMEDVNLRLVSENIVFTESDHAGVAHERYGRPGTYLLENIESAVPETEEDRAGALIAGMPRMGQDINEKTLAAELGQEFLDRTVSFTKGCYVGQEINHRIYARGHVNQQWVRMMSANRIEPGTPVERNGEKVGEVRACLKSRSHDYVCSVFVKGSELPLSLTAGGESLTIIPSKG